MLFTRRSLGALPTVRRALARASSSSVEYPPHILNAPSTEVSKLNNGVRVATQVRD